MASTVAPVRFGVGLVAAHSSDWQMAHRQLRGKRVQRRGPQGQIKYQGAVRSGIMPGGGDLQLDARDGDDDEKEHDILSSASNPQAV